MTPEELKEEKIANDAARKIFYTWDVNSDGNLSRDELKQALKQAQIPVSSTQLDSLYTLMANPNHSNCSHVHEDDFVKFCAMRRLALRRAFDEICPRANNSDKERSFTAQHLRKASLKAGIPLSETDVAHIMQQLDSNQDGVVTFTEFVSSLMLVPHINPHVFFDKWFVDCWEDYQIGPTKIPRGRLTNNNEDFLQVLTQKVTCGGLAGVTSRTITAPLDRIRLMLMTSKTPLTISTAFSQATSTSLLALWMGNGINCIKIAPEMALKLYAFDTLLSRVAQDADNISASERFLAGGCAGAMAEFAVYPLDVMRTRMATGKYGNLRQVVHAVTKDGGGIHGFYAGLTPSIIGIVPYAAIDLSVYSVLKEYAVEYCERHEQHASVPLLLSCGMASSATAASLTFPIMVIRCKAQATGMSIGNVVQALWKEGVRGFYRGFAPSLMTVMPATSISYAAYEWLNTRWKTVMMAKSKSE